jgi:hypothetical protein
MATIRGGEQVAAKLRELADRLRNPGTLRVGFLEKATYPDGKPVAMIAAIQEYGAPRAGIPPRPFFRNMIAAKQAEWAPAIAQLLVQNNYDATRALDIAGAAIAGQLRQSVIDTNAPPLKPATIRRKGFSKPLIETSVMINSIDHDVKPG